MCLDVLLQVSGRTERLSTYVTGEHLLAGVSSHMILESIQTSESTGALSTFVWFLACMSSYVFLEITCSMTRDAAGRTNERLLTGVHSHMRYKTARSREHLLTLTANVRLLLFVLLPMTSQVLPVGKLGCTFVTRVGLDLRVQLDMALQMARVAEVLLAT